MKKVANQTWKLIVAGSVIAGIIGVIPLIGSWLQPDVSGTWIFEVKSEETSFAAYKDAVVTWNVVLNQQDGQVTGQGETIEYNHKTLPPSQRVRMELTGKIEHKKVFLSYTVHAKQRDTQGSFILKLSGSKMDGTFSGTAANSSGTVIATKKE